MPLGGPLPSPHTNIALVEKEVRLSLLLSSGRKGCGSVGLDLEREGVALAYSPSSRIHKGSLIYARENPKLSVNAVSHMLLSWDEGLQHGFVIRRCEQKVSGLRRITYVDTMSNVDAYYRC
ncbi:hypothetical protein PGT21_008414 [Puccinia graminis f. sp. tritici]|uniref:Uncharacterized protein n=1 Tax=Puccinia graminis f. sp. tritici TaxID=56615 RepID=A0A5B0MGW5_PUCGR|nr:hypothetical protein PGT21_008414 [Puccinia graminis f. sp. tritici]